MSPCDNLNHELLRYLDDELGGQELAYFRAHLEGCVRCQVRLEQEQELSNILRRSRPLYTMPPESRAQILEVIEKKSSSAYERQRQWWQTVLPVAFRWNVLLPATVMIALCLIVIPDIVQNVRAANYVETAVATHTKYVSGTLNPEIRSRSAEEITAWFVGKVPFQFHLPNSEPALGSGPSYQLAGASVVSYHGSSAGLVIYDGPNERVSLLIASRKSAVVSGGDEVRYGVLTFHYRSAGKFKVITWTNHDLSYALVSSIAGSAQNSCMVCHHNLTDPDLFHTHP